MLDYIIGIDGTGPSKDEEYKEELKHSHVNRLLDKFQVSQYFRGPEALDHIGNKDCTKYSMSKVEACVAIAQKHRLQRRLWLTGYSRGAGAILEVCHRLKSKRIDVHGLVLYDAVDMTNQYNRGSIPSNVHHCIHFTRNQISSKSRESFRPGTIGRKFDGEMENFSLHSFHCTHGGAGGAFFGKDTVDETTGFINEGGIDQATAVTRSQDYEASALIMSLTNVFVESHRLPARKQAPTAEIKPRGRPRGAKRDAPTPR